MSIHRMYVSDRDLAGEYFVRVQFEPRGPITMFRLPRGEVAAPLGVVSVSNRQGFDNDRRGFVTDRRALGTLGADIAGRRGAGRGRRVDD